VKLIDLDIANFAEQLASKKATPGGGSAAALSGLVGISLVQMVANLTIGRKKYMEHEELMQQILADGQAQHNALLAAIDADAAAYDSVSAAFKLPKETDEEQTFRAAAVQDALKQATLVPLIILQHCFESLKLAHSVVSKCNTNAASDLGVAAITLKAGMEGAWYNILINLGSIKDNNFKDDMRNKASDALDAAAILQMEIQTFVMSEIDI